MPQEFIEALEALAEYADDESARAGFYFQDCREYIDQLAELAVESGFDRVPIKIEVESGDDDEGFKALIVSQIAETGGASSDVARYERTRRSVATVFDPLRKGLRGVKLKCVIGYSARRDGLPVGRHCPLSPNYMSLLRTTLRRWIRQARISGQDSDTTTASTTNAKPRRTGIRRKRKKRDTPTLEMMKAYELRKAGLTLRGIHEQLANSPAQGPVQQTTQSEYDLFICHASEDKAEVVIPLTDELTKQGLRVWVDYRELRLGERLRKRIDEGLRCSQFGIVVVSPHFFAKPWPQNELDGLVALEMADGRKRVLPVWCDVDHVAVAQRSPMLAGRLAANWAQGLTRVVEEILRAVRG